MVLAEQPRLLYFQLALFGDLPDPQLLLLLPPLHLLQLSVFISQLRHAILPLTLHPLLLLFKLLVHGHLGFVLSLLLLDELRLLLLLPLDLCKLLLDVLLLLLAFEVFHLHLKLVPYELVGLSGVPAPLLPVVHAGLLALHDLLVQQVHLLACYPVVVLLLLLLQLLQEFLVGLELKIGDHLVLHARLVFVPLGPLDGVDLLLHGPVALVLDFFLVPQGRLYRVLHCLDMLEPSHPLQLVEPDPLLEQLLHLGSHPQLPLGLSVDLCLLLDPHVFLLLHDLARLLSQVHQNLVFLLDLLLIVHDLLSQVVLKSHEVVWVPHKRLVDLATLVGAANWKVLLQVAERDGSLMLLMQLLGELPHFVERDARGLVQPPRHVLDAADLEDRRLGADQVGNQEVE